MAETKKKGLLSKLIGTKKSGCCDITIEEVKEDKGKEKKDQLQKK